MSSKYLILVAKKSGNKKVLEMKELQEVWLKTAR